jgi:hypothetical protein
MKKKGLLVFLIVGAVFVFTLPGYATLLEYNLGLKYEGAEPAGPPPWLSATFDDQDKPGSVQLTMDAAGLTRYTDNSTEFVTKWLFNVNVDSLLPTGISKSAKSGLLANNSGGPGRKGGPLVKYWARRRFKNKFKQVFKPQLALGSTSLVDEQTLLDNLDFKLVSGTQPSALDRTANFSGLTPAEGFDIEFSWSESNGQRFEASEMVIFDISSELPITANTFLALNSKGLLFETVAQVQGIVSSAGDRGNIAQGSGPNPIPEPTTLLLLGIGLIGLIGFGYKRFKA